MPPGPVPNAAQMAEMVNAIGRQLMGVTMMVQKLKRNLYRLEAIEKLQSLGKKPVYPVEFRSQFGEDALAWELFDGKTEGFFIEVGAFDGYNYAVTYALGVPWMEGSFDRGDSGACGAVQGAEEEQPRGACGTCEQARRRGDIQRDGRCVRWDVVVS
jgi:hypothetical protein